jgi:hypothetical protein
MSLDWKIGFEIELLQSWPFRRLRQFRLTAKGRPGGVDAFFNAGVDTCDAELLSQYWNMDLDATKANAGTKILRGDKRIVRQAIKAAGRKFNCTVGFNYNDADRSRICGSRHEPA